MLLKKFVHDLLLRILAFADVQIVKDHLRRFLPKHKGRC